MKQVYLPDLYVFFEFYRSKENSLRFQGCYASLSVGKPLPHGALKKPEQIRFFNNSNSIQSWLPERQLPEQMKA